jgi:hypothetical protein
VEESHILALKATTQSKVSLAFESPHVDYCTLYNIVKYCRLKVNHMKEQQNMNLCSGLLAWLLILTIGATNVNNLQISVLHKY